MCIHVLQIPESLFDPVQGDEIRSPAGGHLLNPAPRILRRGMQLPSHPSFVAIWLDLWTYFLEAEDFPYWTHKINFLQSVNSSHPASDFLY